LIGNPMFKDMNTSQAREFFQRYMSEKDESLGLLKNEVATSGTPWAAIPLDYSPGSLVDVWQYFLAKVTTVPRPEENLRSVPDWVRPSLAPVVFSSETKLRIVWVSFYFAEVVLRECPAAKWGVSKKAQFRNHPALVGFKYVYDLSPLTLVESEGYKALRGDSTPTALLDALERWRLKQSQF
jgi:hypothetical protein